MTLGSLLGFCLCCVLAYKIVPKMIDNRLRSHVNNSFAFQTRKV